MEEVLLLRKERIQMFLKEYYFGGSLLIIIARLIGGPIAFFVGLTMYSEASDRLGIAYGTLLFVASIYYTFLPLLWVLVRWEAFKSIEVQLETTPNQLIIKEVGSESHIEYSKFDKIVKRKNYFVLVVQKGLKIYLPTEKLSEQNIDILTKELHG